MGSRAEGGRRSKGEGDVDAKGGRMVAIGKSLWTSDQKLLSYTARSRISISVYSAENKKGWTMGVANCTQGGTGLKMTVRRMGQLCRG